MGETVWKGNAMEENVSKPVKIIKGAITLFMFTLAGLLFFRFWLHGYYPRAVRDLIPTEALRASYAASGVPDAKTQEIRVKYDDPNEGLFFADHMVVVPETGSIQISARYNKSTLEKVAERYGDAFDPEADEPFTYRIFCYTGSAEDGTAIGQIYEPVECREDSFAMYHYRRLAFDGVSLEGVKWIRLEIFRTGAEEAESYIAIYEDHEDYNTFTEYKIKEKELS